MLQARRSSTNRLYQNYIAKWQKYCGERGIAYHSPSVPEALGFLQELLQDSNSHRGYSAICTARSALSAVIILPDNQKFGDHPHVKQYIKGVFNKDPPKPRYVSTWDPQCVIDLLKSWYPAKSLSLLQLSKKVVMLILLVTGQRGQIITALNVDRMELKHSMVTFHIRNEDLKQGRQNHRPDPIKLRAFPDKRVCVVHYVKTYLERTLDLRKKEKQLVLTACRPHKAASRDTISRWVKSVMTEAGVDVATFKPGSTRAAASSKACAAGVAIDLILKAGGWSTETTFSRWYKKTVRKDQNRFAQAILN